MSAKSIGIRVLLLATLLFGRRAGADTVSVDDSFEELSLGKHLELAYDPTGTISIEDVLAGKLQFAPSEKSVPSFGYRKGAEWARVDVIDRRGNAAPLRVESGYGQSDRLDLFEVEEGRVVHEASVGDHVPTSQWDIVARTPTYRLAATPRPRSLYFRLTGEASHQLPLMLLSDARSDRRLLIDAVAQALFYGAMLGMIAYNLLLAMATRVRAYGLYVAFMCSNAVVHLSYTGLLPPLGIELPWVVDFIVPVMISWTMWIAVSFAVDLLGLRSTQPRLTRGLEVFVRAVAGAVLVAIPFGYSVAARAALAGLVPWAFALLVASCREARNGSRVARIYFAAWIALLLGTTVTGLRNLGWLPVNAFTNGATSFGTTIEVLTLSFALSDRIKQLQHEVVLRGDAALAHAQEALVQAERAKTSSEEALEAREHAMRELEERRRVQGELDQATQQLTQAENMATLGMLMAGIAHDLRNPLNYVQGASEQLRSVIPELWSDDPSRREKSIARLEKVVGWVEQGTASMDAISLAMRNQARSGGAEMSDVSVGEVVNEALLLCRSRTKLCEVEVDVPDATIRADATGLGQLVMNLVSNAADAILEAREKNSEQPARIRVSARVEGDCFVLAVEDSGPGIPAHVCARILEPFFTTKPRGQGTGLGLAIVQRVVKQHGATLEIGRSEVLGGASFRVVGPAGG